MAVGGGGGDDNDTLWPRLTEVRIAILLCALDWKRQTESERKRKRERERELVDRYRLIRIKRRVYTNNRQVYGSIYGCWRKQGGNCIHNEPNKRYRALTRSSKIKIGTEYKDLCHSSTLYGTGMVPCHLTLCQQSTYLPSLSWYRIPNVGIIIVFSLLSCWLF